MKFIKKIYNNPLFRNTLRNVLNSNAVFRAIYRFLLCVKNNGIDGTAKKVKQWCVIRVNRWRKKTVFTPPSKEGRRIQGEKNFDKDITFSIVVPLYNTPKIFLNEMIKSVLNQTYEKWELCIADGSDAEHNYVEAICQKYVMKDSRIRYKKLEKNLGISENTNACLQMATGNYIGLFDHDDLLHPSVLYLYMEEICNHDADYIYCDELTFTGKKKKIVGINYKPDFSIDYLRSNNYICHFSVFSRELLNKVGGFNARFDGSQDYDMILRLTEQAVHIRHVPEILYFWRAHKNSVASDISAKMYTIDAAKQALVEHYKRCGLECEVENTKILSWYRTKYKIMGSPLVSIIIPNKDSVEILKQCIDSIINKSTYENYEIIIVENNSENEETFQYYKTLELIDNIKVVIWEEEFNYSKINNFGFQYANGEYVLLLNNDIEVITPSWIEEMLMFNQREDVGAVGAMLYYPNDTIQHAGVIVGIGGVAGHSHKYFPRGDYGYMGRLMIAQNLSAVTAACMMLKRSVYEEVRGIDEGFAVAFNDVDFCMRIREAGHLICWTPYAELYHHESISRGQEDTLEKQKRFLGEVERFQERWKEELEAGDPYYNRNLSLIREDFSYE